MYSMFSEKGKELRVVDNYKFRNIGFVKRGQKWRCVNKECNARFFVQTGGGVIFEGTHTHGPCTTLPRQFISNNLKKRLVDELNERPSKLVRKEILQAPSMIAETLTNFDLGCIRRSFFLSKRKHKKKLSSLAENGHEEFHGNTSERRNYENNPSSQLQVTECTSKILEPATFDSRLNSHPLEECDRKILHPEVSNSSSICQQPCHDGNRIFNNEENYGSNSSTQPQLVEYKSEILEPRASNSCSVSQQPCHGGNRVYSSEENYEDNSSTQLLLKKCNRDILEPEASISSSISPQPCQDGDRINNDEGNYEDNPSTQLLLEECKSEILESEASDSSSTCEQSCYNDDKEILLNPEQVCVKPERDRFDVLGERVAYELRHLDTEYAQKTLEHLISSLLYDARLGKYNEPPANDSTLQDINSLANT